MSSKFITWEEAVLWLRNQPDQQELVRACYYDDPLSEAAERYYRSGEWRSVKALLKGQGLGKALDLGAGRGISSYSLAREGWDVTALEPDHSHIVGAEAIRSLAKQSGLEIAVCVSFGEILPFPRNHFDLVYARQVLHHAHNLEKFCQEIYRVLRSGGLFVATREHVIDRHEDLALFQKAHPLHALYGGEHAYLLSEYQNAIKQAGLRLDKTLAPYDSEINLSPATIEDARQKMAKKTGFLLPMKIFKKLAVPLLNRWIREPGRLYTFVGRKP